MLTLAYISIHLHFFVMKGFLSNRKRSRAAPSQKKINAKVTRINRSKGCAQLLKISKNNPTEIGPMASKK